VISLTGKRTTVLTRPGGGITVFLDIATPTQFQLKSA
jgi:hypothetical protein